MYFPGWDPHTHPSNLNIHTHNRAIGGEHNVSFVSLAAGGLSEALFQQGLNWLAGIFFSPRLLMLMDLNTFSLLCPSFYEFFLKNNDDGPYILL